MNTVTAVSSGWNHLFSGAEELRTLVANSPHPRSLEYGSAGKCKFL